jgi:hypothetical protein
MGDSEHNYDSSPSYMSNNDDNDDNVDEGKSARGGDNDNNDDDNDDDEHNIINNSTLVNNNIVGYNDIGNGVNASSEELKQQCIVPDESILCTISNRSNGCCN